MIVTIIIHNNNVDNNNNDQSFYYLYKVLAHVLICIRIPICIQSVCNVLVNILFI